MQVFAIVGCCASEKGMQRRTLLGDIDFDTRYELLEGRGQTCVIYGLS
jgi:hypothetical protein